VTIRCPATRWTISIDTAAELDGLRMVGTIISLAGYAFLCGAIGFVHWLGFRIRANDPVRRSVQRPLGREQLGPTSRSAPTWCKPLLAFAGGACAAALFFVHFVKSSHGGVHLTQLEYLAINYGVWAAAGGFLVICVFAAKLNINPIEGSAVYPLIFFVGSATSLVLYYVLWQAGL
jgi:hypothetical protein